VRCSGFQKNRKTLSQDILNEQAKHPMTIIVGGKGKAKKSPTRRTIKRRQDGKFMFMGALK
jgi:hypothetical protein